MNTRTDNFVNKVKDHPILSVIIITFVLLAFALGLFVNFTSIYDRYFKTEEIDKVDSVQKPSKTDTIFIPQVNNTLSDSISQLSNKKNLVSSNDNKRTIDEKLSSDSKSYDESTKVALIDSIPFKKSDEKKPEIKQPEFVDTLTPDYINKYWNDFPPLQRDQVIEYFKDIKVTWTYPIYTMSKLKYNNKEMISIYLNYNGIYSVNFIVGEKDYPGLSLLKEGQLMTITGYISKITPLSISLKNTTIISY